MRLSRCIVEYGLMPNNLPIPIRFRPSAKALIVHHGKILVIKERIKQDRTMTIIYDFPGGGIELGETVAEALHREVFEEVGLKVRIEKPVGSWDFLVKGKNQLGSVHIICLGFQCELSGDAPINTTNNPAQEDIIEATWLSREEILQLPVSDWSADIRSVLQNITFRS